MFTKWESTGAQNKSWSARFEVFTVVKIQVEVFTLKMGVASSSETAVSCRKITRRHNQEDLDLKSWSAIRQEDDDFKFSRTMWKLRPGQVTLKWADSIMGYEDDDEDFIPRDFGLNTWMIGGSNPGRGWEFFSSPPRPDRLWGPSSLLSNGYQGFFPWG
jgi:hypothetical protein